MGAHGSSGFGDKTEGSHVSGGGGNGGSEERGDGAAGGGTILKFQRR